MDTAKVKPSQPVPPVQSATRTQDSNTRKMAQTRTQTDSKSPYDTPRQTTNSQGQAIGTRINYKA